MVHRERFPLLANNPEISIPICGALRDLVPCAQFKKHEKHPWRSATFSKVGGLNRATHQIYRMKSILNQQLPFIKEAKTMPPIDFIYQRVCRS